MASIFSTDELTHNVESILAQQKLQSHFEQQQAPDNTKYHVPDAFHTPLPSKYPPALAPNVASSTSFANSLNVLPSDVVTNLTASEAVKVSAILNEQPIGSTSCYNSYSSQTSAIIPPMQHQPPLLTRPSSKALLNNILPRPTTAIERLGAPCNHANAGQEMCYLCHQRQRRNVPVYLHEETRQKEKEETQLLMQYQQLKDMEKLLQDEEKSNARRLERAKMDAFNLGISEAIKEKKMERPKSSDLSVS